MEAIKRDPEVVQIIQDLYIKQQREKRDFFESHEVYEAPSATNEKRATASNCLTHPLPDFYPTNITGLKKFPEAAYPYQDPKPSDQRGPCPGLNTLANHGYINRNGITTVAQTIAAGAQVFNMGADLSAFLAGGSVLFAGDIASMTYSIGGADARTNSLGVVGGSLGTETGLSGHLRFKEGDASGTRCDFYLCNGDNHNLNSSVFLDLQNAAKTYGGGQCNVPALTQHFAHQYTKSRNNNPYFYFFPPQAALVIGATYFIAGFFSNGTIGAGGVANEASIASFTGAYFNSSTGAVTYQPEQIPPQGWYRRGYPMFLSEGIDGIITLYTGAAATLGKLQSVNVLKVLGRMNETRLTYFQASLFSSAQTLAPPAPSPVASHSPSLAAVAPTVEPQSTVSHARSKNPFTVTLSPNSAPSSTLAPQPSAPLKLLSVNLGAQSRADPQPLRPMRQHILGIRSRSLAS